MELAEERFCDEIVNEIAGNKNKNKNKIKPFTSKTSHNTEFCSSISKQ